MRSVPDTTGAGGGEVAKKEALLSQSGFKVITVTDPKQQQAVSGLTQGRCLGRDITTGSCITCFPLATKDKIYVAKTSPIQRSIRRPSRLTEASQPATHVIFNTPKKSTNPTKIKAYEKTNNINKSSPVSVRSWH